jgi:MYXO-CTERM domain-containing protein
MRRVPLALLLAAPALALGQTLTDGTLVFDPEDVNQSMCTDALDGDVPVPTPSTIELDWRISITDGATFTSGGDYAIFASTRKWDADEGESNTDFCDESSTAGSGFTASQVGVDFTANAQTDSLSVDVEDILAAVGITAATENACSSDRTIYVCVHWYRDGETRTGWARRQLKLSFQAPGAPVLNSVTPGDGRLHVDWSAPTTGATVGYYKIRATNAANAADTRTTGEIKNTSGTIDGLTNDETYNVVVFAFTASDNVSLESNTVQGTPQLVDDFFEHYQGEGGREQGGCTTGAAGVVALLGAAALLALRRRKP